MRVRRAGGWILAVVAVLSVAALMVFVLRSLTTAARDRSQQAHAIETLAESLAEANDRLEEAGQSPVAVPDESEVLRGVDGDDGQDGRSAYEVWLDAGNQGTRADFLESLRGRDGEPGADATPPPPGANGVDGTDGQDGSPGRPPTPAEVLAAVGSYCTANPGVCQGPPGNDGPPGADSQVPGPPGPQGPPGPTCPDGMASRMLWVDVAESELGLPTRVQAAVCVVAAAG